MMPNDTSVATTPQMDEPTLDLLRAELERGGVCDQTSLGAIFVYPKLDVVYLNTLGAAIISPSFEGTEAAAAFHFGDIVSVSEKQRFDTNINPMLQIKGDWQGVLVMRDLWGGDVILDVEIWLKSVKTGDSTAKFLFLKGDPTENITFKGMRGWQDRSLLLALLGHTPDAVFFKDRESRFIRASMSMIQRLGLKYPHEIIGKTDFHFFSVGFASATYEAEQRIVATGESLVDEEVFELQEDGSKRWVLMNKIPVYEANGEVSGVFGWARDITKRKAQEAEQENMVLRLQLAQRLEAIGSLAAGVAHEINTPTQFVSDNLKFLGDAFSDLDKVLRLSLALVEQAKETDTLRSHCAAIEDAVEECDLEFLREEIPGTLTQSLEGMRQIGKIVGAMKEFSYPSAHEKAKADLNHAIRNTVNVSRNEWKNVAELQLDLDESLPEVSCMVDEINQVILNLVVNAAHAIEATDSRWGTIEVASRSTGKNIEIEVKDSGSGMTEEVRSRMFEQFFTTKEVGKGTGQGLALVRSVIVNTHGGEIDCESEVGKGTVFRIRLPIE